MSYWDWGYYKPKPRKTVKGGIRAQSKRGSFGESWWAKRWISVLESFDIGARLNRGRSYARGGQVLSIDVDKGGIKARVQGSSSSPYKISINIQVIPESGWKKLASSLSTQAIFAAKLLAGQMPDEIEGAFNDAGISLFPAKLSDLETSCSCPDWSNPCKHIAAVYYLLGEEFDRDPFLIFKLRGMNREDFVIMLGAAAKSAGSAENKETSAKLPPQPLVAEAAAFWRGGNIPDDLFGEVGVPPVDAALPKRLGCFPFWRGAENLLDAIEPIYRKASTRGLEILTGSEGNFR